MGNILTGTRVECVNRYRVNFGKTGNVRHFIACVEWDDGRIEELPESDLKVVDHA